MSDENWTFNAQLESISCWCFAQMFSHFHGPLIMEQECNRLDPFGPKRTNLCKQMFR